MSEEPGRYAIRPASPDDRDAFFEICLKTADHGADATMLYGNPRLPGYIWAVPYLELEPGFAFALADERETIGYVVGTPVTTRFDRRLEKEWWPEARRQIDGLMPSRPLDERALDIIRHPPIHDEPFQADYPAHLHINILPRGQGAGWGRRLIEAEFDAMRAAGVDGLHLGVGPRNFRAVSFYEHVGFERLINPNGVTFGIEL